MNAGSTPPSTSCGSRCQKAGGSAPPGARKTLHAFIIFPILAIAVMMIVRVDGYMLVPHISSARPESAGIRPDLARSTVLYL
eukprot:5248151-Prymnesium_polylepis.1